MLGYFVAHDLHRIRIQHARTSRASTSTCTCARASDLDDKQQCLDILSLPLKKGLRHGPTLPPDFSAGEFSPALTSGRSLGETDKRAPF